MSRDYEEGVDLRNPEEFDTWKNLHKSSRVQALLKEVEEFDLEERKEFLKLLEAKYGGSSLH